MLVPGTIRASDANDMHAGGAFTPDRTAPSMHGAISTTATASMSTAAALHAIDWVDSQRPLHNENDTDAWATAPPVATAGVEVESGSSKPVPLSLAHALPSKCSEEMHPFGSPDTPAFGYLRKDSSGAFTDASALAPGEQGGISRGLSTGASVAVGRGSSSCQGFGGTTGKILGKAVEECRVCVRDILGAAVKASNVPCVRFCFLSY